jgi:hypothetical protein
VATIQSRARHIARSVPVHIDTAEYALCSVQNKFEYKFRPVHSLFSFISARLHTKHVACAITTVANSKIERKKHYKKQNKKTATRPTVLH